MKVVIDTNVLLVSISERSKHHWLYQALLDQKFNACVTNDLHLGVNNFEIASLQKRRVR